MSRAIDEAIRRSIKSAGECVCCLHKVIVRDTRPGPTKGMCLDCIRRRSELGKTLFESRMRKYRSLTWGLERAVITNLDIRLSEKLPYFESS